MIFKSLLKFKVFMDKELSVVIIFRIINNAQSNRLYENCDILNIESEIVKKFINLFLVLDREKKVESLINKFVIFVKLLGRLDSDKLVLLWKMLKFVESDKFILFWKVFKLDIDLEKRVFVWKVVRDF